MKSEELLYYNIWTNIFHFCNDHSLLQLRAVSRTLHEISDSDKVWKPRSEAAKSRTLKGLRYYEEYHKLPSKRVEPLSSSDLEKSLADFKAMMVDQSTATTRTTNGENDDHDDFTSFMIRCLTRSRQVLFSQDVEEENDYISNRYRKSISSLYQNSKLVKSLDLCPFTNKYFIQTLCFESMMYGFANILQSPEIFEKSSSSSLLLVAGKYCYFLDPLLSILHFSFCYLKSHVSTNNIVVRMIGAIPCQLIDENFHVIVPDFTSRDVYEYGSSCPHYCIHETRPLRRNLGLIVKFEEREQEKRKGKEQRKQKKKSQEEEKHKHENCTCDSSSSDDDDDEEDEELFDAAMFGFDDEDSSDYEEYSEKEKIYELPHFLTFYETRRLLKNRKERDDSGIKNYNCTNRLILAKKFVAETIHVEMTRKMNALRVAREILSKSGHLAAWFAIAAVICFVSTMMLIILCYFVDSDFADEVERGLWNENNMTMLSEEFSFFSATTANNTSSKSSIFIRQYQIADSWFSALLPFFKKDFYFKMIHACIGYYKAFPHQGLTKNKPTRVFENSLYENILRYIITSVLVGGELCFCWFSGRTDDLVLYQRFKRKTQYFLQFFADIFFFMLLHFIQIEVEWASVVIFGFPVTVLWETVYAFARVLLTKLPVALYKDMSVVLPQLLFTSSVFQQENYACNSLDVLQYEFFKATPGYLLETAEINLVNSSSSSTTTTIIPLIGIEEMHIVTLLPAITIVLLFGAGYWNRVVQDPFGDATFWEMIRCGSWTLPTVLMHCGMMKKFSQDVKYFDGRVLNIVPLLIRMFEYAVYGALLNLGRTFISEVARWNHWRKIPKEDLEYYDDEDKYLPE